jgi:hypothetical protein
MALQSALMGLQQLQINTEFEVLTAAVMKNSICWRYNTM